MNANWLEDKFDDFYLKLIEQVESVTSGRESMPGETSNVQDSAPWREMVALLERQKSESEQLTMASARFYGEAMYAMAAFADQVFINTAWYGAKAWRASCLEWRFFMSAEGGRKFFENADRMIADGDPGAREVCKIYFNCIALGFRGIHQGATGSDQIARYKNSLRARFLADQTASMKISDAAYQHTREEDVRGFLPSIGIPLLGLVVAAVLAFLVYEGSYKLQMQTLEGLPEKIEKRIEGREE